MVILEVGAVAVARVEVEQRNNFGRAAIQPIPCGRCHERRKNFEIDTPQGVSL